MSKTKGKTSPFYYPLRCTVTYRSLTISNNGGAEILLISQVHYILIPKAVLHDKTKAKVVFWVLV